jgi:hypothetical protein
MMNLGEKMTEEECNSLIDVSTYSTVVVFTDLSRFTIKP